MPYRFLLACLAYLLCALPASAQEDRQALNLHTIDYAKSDSCFWQSIETQKRILDGSYIRDITRDTCLWCMGFQDIVLELSYAGDTLVDIRASYFTYEHFARSMEVEIRETFLSPPLVVPCETRPRYITLSFGATGYYKKNVVYLPPKVAAALSELSPPFPIVFYKIRKKRKRGSEPPGARFSLDE